MHVPPGPPWNPAAAEVRELVDGTLIEAEQGARGAAPQVETTREVTVGEPLMVLEIESRSAALVVVGSRGLGAFGSLLLGSTAVHLTAHGRCPVLVVRGRPDPNGPVLLAVDGSPAGEKAVEFASAEASLRGVDLVALHVWNTWSERAYEGPGDPLNVVVDIERLREEEQRLLDDTLSPWQERHPGVTVQRRLVRSRVRPALIEASRESQLVVAGARGRGGFTGLLLGSVSQALTTCSCSSATGSRAFPRPWKPSGLARLSRRGWFTCCAIRSVTPLVRSGTRSPRHSSLSAPHPARTRRRSGSRSSRESWGGKYPAIVKPWSDAWAEFVPFLSSDVEIRKVICSTNAIESVDARIRRAVRARGHFPNEAAA